MLEPATVGVDADELRLAQLACAKLAGLVQGALSIGLPALRTGVPEPRGFLVDRFRVMTGFALVLHSVSGKPGGQHEVLRLRERSRDVLAALEDLRQRLLEYLDSSGGAARTLAPARNAASTLCDAIDAYADLIQLDRSRITRVKGVVQQVFDGVENLKSVGEPAGG
jgi:hypothetical protein